MRTYLLIFIILTSACTGLLHAQEIPERKGLKATLPDTITLSLSDWDTYDNYLKKADDEGFKPLGSKTPLNDYKGKENKNIMRAVRNIKYTIQRNDILYDKIAGSSIASLRNLIYGNREGEHHILRSPRYALTVKGVILAGESDVLAPWNDMLTNRRNLDFYFIGYDKKVRHIKSVSVRRKPLPASFVIFRPKSLSYEYPDSLPADSASERIPPVLMEERAGSLKKYIESNTKYSPVAVENYMQGTVQASFLVNPDRNITDVKIEKPAEIFFDKEVARIIKQTNGIWNPGTVNDTKVPVMVKLEVIFELRVL